MTGRARVWPQAVMALVLGVLLTACAEEESGPQFANDPAPIRVPTETPLAASPAALLATPIAATPVAATPASISDLLTTRGAPSRLFVVANEVVWAVSTAGESTQAYTADAQERIVASDAAPGGERVAILVATTTEGGERPDVVVVNSDGDVEWRLDGVAAALATPAPDAGWPTAVAIDWSPQGDRALVSFRDGAIVEFPIGSGESRVLLPSAGTPNSILDPSWSPTGEAVAFIATGEDGRARALHTLGIRDGTVNAVVTPPPGRFVVDSAWMPNGVSLLFTEGGELGGAVTGIDLWSVGADGENRKLVVSAGTVAPVARIASPRPSPDGKSVAYAVLLPGESEARVDSVWIRDLDSRVGFRARLPSVISVNELTWTDRGLVMAVATGAAQSTRSPVQALLLLDREGTVSALWAAPLTAATPAAGTPVGRADDG